MKGALDEVPVESVISLFQVELNAHPTHIPCFLTHRVKDFLHENDIITYLSLRHKTNLCGGDEVRENTFQALHNYLCEHLVCHVT